MSDMDVQGNPADFEDPERFEKPDYPHSDADDSGYAPDDPKHPTYHSRMSELWDSREGK